MVLKSTGVFGLLRQVAYELIPADHKHFESLVRLCMKSGQHHDVKNARAIFFAVCLTVCPFEF